MNAEAWEDLLKEQMQAVHRYLLSAGAGRAEAEDIVQETLYQAILHIEAIPPEIFRPWLFRVAINRYHDARRRRAKLREVPLDPAVVAGGRTPEDIVLGRAKREMVLGVFGEIKPVYRRLLLLKYNLGLTYRQIAGVVGMKEETVKKYLYRARLEFQAKFRRVDR